MNKDQERRPVLLHFQLDVYWKPGWRRYAFPWSARILRYQEVAARDHEPPDQKDRRQAHAISADIA